MIKEFNVNSILNIENNEEASQKFKQFFRKKLIDFNKHAYRCGEFLEAGPLDSSSEYSRDIFSLYGGESNDVGLISSDIEELYEGGSEVFHNDIHSERYGFLGLFRKEVGLGCEIAFNKPLGYASGNDDSHTRFKLTESSLKEYFGISFLSTLQENFIKKSQSGFERYFGNAIDFSMFGEDDLHWDTNLLEFFRSDSEDNMFADSENLWALLETKLAPEVNQSGAKGFVSLCFESDPYIFDLKQIDSNHFYTEISSVIKEYWDKKDESGALTLLYADFFEMIFFQSFLDSIHSVLSKVTRELQVLLKTVVVLFTNSKFELEARAAMLFQMQLESFSKGWIKQVVDKNNCTL